MTILEAIKESIGYPISEKMAEMTLLKRGMNKTDEATETVLNSKNFELATADLMFWMITVTNFSENGISLSVTDKSTLKELASGIYAKHGIAIPTASTASFISPW